MYNNPNQYIPFYEYKTPKSLKNYYLYFCLLFIFALLFFFLYFLLFEYFFPSFPLNREDICG